MKKQCILVTGASGFIGAAVCRAAVAAGRRVIGLCRDLERGRKKLAGLGDAATLATWDMPDPLPRIDGVDAVIHAAGRGDPSSFAAAPATAMNETLLGCQRLLDFAATNKVKWFLLVSSGEAYGMLHLNRRIRETDQGVVDPASPRSLYPLAKIATEGLALAYWRQHRLPILTARLCHIYGSGMSPRDPRIAAHFPRLAARGGDIVLKTPGDQRRSWCHIDDAARAILTILDKGLPGELYTVADESSELTVREFAERIAAAGKVAVRFAPATQAEEKLFNPMPSAVFDSGKLRSLGWSARQAIDDGLAACVRSALAEA